jgi:hypothetical protein
MRRHFFGAAIFLLALLIGSGLAAAKQDQKAQDQESCDSHPKLLRDNRGKPVLLSFKQLKEKVTHCEPVRLPGTWDIKATALVQILIEPDGTVQCAKAIYSHPMVRPLAERTALKWTFKPVEHQGERIAVLTVLQMHISWEYKAARKRQCGKE